MFEPLVDRDVTLADGRRLAFAEWGVLDGPTVIFFHGTPHSRLWCPDVAATAEAGVHLVTVDRPGYGRSDPPPAEVTLGDWTGDIAQLVDSLAVDRVGVVGWSGGAGYALACAAVISERLTGAGEIGGAGWPVDEQPGAYDKLDEDSQRVYDLAQSDRNAAVHLAEELATEWIKQLQADPSGGWEGNEPAQDLRHFDDAAWAENFYQATREAVRQGPRCYSWDSVVNFAPWGFALEDVAIKFHLWHGDREPYESMASVDFWASRIPSAEVTTYPDSGHFAVVDHWREILSSVVETDLPESADS